MLLALYSFSRAVRETLLTGMFGAVSVCKHSPTCGEAIVQAIQTKNWKTFFQAIKQLSTCF